MKDFSLLIERLDQLTKTTEKVKVLSDYFRTAPQKDVVWAIAIWSHRRPKRPVSTTLLRAWAAELAEVDQWLFEDSYHIVGDLAETIALLTCKKEIAIDHSKESLSTIINDLIALKTLSEDQKKAYITSKWVELNYFGSFTFTKLLTGGFRIGISQKLMTKALESAFDIPSDEIAYRLMGKWDPTEVTLKKLLFDNDPEANQSRPYPFFLAHPVENTLKDLGDVSQWSIEHKWDGIRAQLIKRKETFAIWSRGEELITEQFPELHPIKDQLKEDVVIDGEIIPIKDGLPDHFGTLQKRLNRKRITNSLLEEAPVVFRAYDLLEHQGKDLRAQTYLERRNYLESIPFSGPLQLSKFEIFKNWREVEDERLRSKQVKSEGLMLKRIDSTYGVGRKKGDWFKYKNDPLNCDAVLTYVMRGHGRRSSLYTDFTFALWDRNPKDPEAHLVTFAKAYSGLTDQEFKEINRWIRSNALEKFGPVRSVKPELVFEIAFEGVAPSSRHKSGYATRFPRIVRWRKDKRIDEANRLEDLKNLVR
jgi:DNA ligase-1